MSSFCFLLTERCNWNCEYCEFPLKRDPKDTTIEILSNHLPYIKGIMNKMEPYLHFSSVDGGELGLLPRQTLKYFFETINYPMVVCTNGKFLRNGYHRDFRPYITEVWYHVDMNHEIGEYGDFVKKGIVHNDVDELVDFINQTDVMFDYVELEFHVLVEREVNYRSYEDLWNKIKDLDNISKKAKNIIARRITEVRNLRQSCTGYNSTYVIDLVNEAIPLCHRSQINPLPLTKWQLKHRITSFPHKLYNKYMNRCGSCTRLFANKFDANTFSEIHKIRKLL